MDYAEMTLEELKAERGEIDREITSREIPNNNQWVVERISTANGYAQLEAIKCGNGRCRKGCREGIPSHPPKWYSYSYSPTGKLQRKYLGNVRPWEDYYRPVPRHYYGDTHGRSATSAVIYQPSRRRD